MLIIEELVSISRVLVTCLENLACLSIQVIHNHILIDLLWVTIPELQLQAWAPALAADEQRKQQSGSSSAACGEYNKHTQRTPEGEHTL